MGVSGHMHQVKRGEERLTDGHAPVWLSRTDEKVGEGMKGWRERIAMEQSGVTRDASVRCE